ncbi:hypothetical protein FISHEDRAFT_66876 [Fistulina hepatica ATCC 64428]|uniref:Chromatin modification-related protein EAF7 n=1 Tax=Fistulina hepatica ATCC 64428 TaxID=1128425 RepID=A0A0D7A5D5_9AGAR|nr:hypothetical protein FISHEDRAFT_66876 [Fistulina hepatica ATCC 64428]
MLLPEFLNTIEGEIVFFRAVMRARPVGKHRHFHIIAIRNAIHNDTGRWIPIPDLWDKLKTCYDIDALNAIDIEAEGYESPISNVSTPVSIKTPMPTDNLAAHPFFREEFRLPFEEYAHLMAGRQLRSTPSPASTPARSPNAPTVRTRRRKRSGTKSDMAGLVGGDSDSSALTQESGDETISTPIESAHTGTEATDPGDEDEADVPLASSGTLLSGKSAPKARAKSKRGPNTAQRTTRATANARTSKKKKR